MELSLTELTNLKSFMQITTEYFTPLTTILRTCTPKKHIFFRGFNHLTNLKATSTHILEMHHSNPSLSFGYSDCPFCGLSVGRWACRAGRPDLISRQEQELLSLLPLSERPWGESRPHFAWQGRLISKGRRVQFSQKYCEKSK